MSEQEEYQENVIDTSVEIRNDEEPILAPSPWQMPISLITWGFILTTFTLNFLLLQYILPTIGVLLFLLAFRILRKGNQLFFVAYVIAVIKVLFQTIVLMINATPYNTLLTNNSIYVSIVLVLQFTLLLVFRQGFKAVYVKSNIVPSRDPLLGIIIWTTLITACSLFLAVYIIILFIPLLIMFILVLRSFHKIDEELRIAKIEMTKAPMKLNNLLILIGYSVSCLILVLICCSFANHLILKESKQSAITNSTTREELITLGFPTNILMNMPDEDVAFLSGAIFVEASTDSLAFNPIDVTTKTGTNSYTITQKPQDCNLQATTVYVELTGNLLYVLEYFDWADSNAYWQDGFTITGEDNLELLSGALLFLKNGVPYTSSIPRLNCGNATSYSMFGATESKQISGAVSFPFHSTNQRGYVFYRVQITKEQWLTYNLLNYVHFNNPLQFPYEETEQRIIKSNYVFHNRLKQHYTTFDMQALRDEEAANQKGE